MKLKQWQNIFHTIANANSIVQHVIEIKNEILKRDNVSVKVITHARKTIVRIHEHVFVRTTSI